MWCVPATFLVMVVFHRVSDFQFQLYNQFVPLIYYVHYQYELIVMLESHNYIHISSKCLFLVCTKEMN